MKLNAEIHRKRAWRVHTVAPDFQLLDVWRFDLGHRTADLEPFLPCLWGAGAAIENSWLARLRLWIGRALGWDDHDFTLPIPGCPEMSVAARLVAADHSANRAAPDSPSPLKAVPVKTVYVFGDEALYEISNDTIHALLHVGVANSPAEGGSASLAVYIKSRGLHSRLYMALINPFRHLIVYPTLIGLVEGSWRRASSSAAPR